ncbi:MAG: hypothetical protein H8E55_51430 [Pelagibacterales bacterium]|nr:hypothetical protein [Pelagibacterales bacterium]
MEFEITKSKETVSNFAEVSKNLEGKLETPHLDENRVNKHIKTFPINVMSDRLMTTEVKVESPNWNVEGNTKGLIKVMNTWFNYYKQIENNLVVGAKAIFLVCRDLYDAQQNLPPKEFELLKQKIHLSEATISKYIIVGKSTLCRELFTMNRLPESWTTMYKIAKVKETEKQQKIKDKVNLGSTASDIDIFIGVMKNELAPIWNYTLENPQDFLRVAFNRIPNHLIDPNALALLKDKIEKVVSKEIETFNSTTKGYCLNKNKDNQIVDNEPVKVEVVANKKLIDNLYERAAKFLDKFTRTKDVKDDYKKRFVEQQTLIVNPTLAKLGN